jgi:DNA-binding transcriptional regulator YhcF (GntR family)
MDSDTASPSTPRASSVARIPSDTNLSYKYQRLRERLRSAITTGELSGRLPGERALSRRFRVNAKTLSKALTDLAAEGLLERSIGRGTYVAGQAPESPAQTRWLIVCDPAVSDPLVAELLRINGESRCIAPAEIVRPSLLSQCSVAINCSDATPDNFYREMMVRGIPVIETCRISPSFATHAALMDKSLAAYHLARGLLLTGHTHIAVMESPDSTALLDAVKPAIARYNTTATFLPAAPDQLDELISQGVTAAICDGNARAQQVRQLLEQRRLFPGCGEMSLCAIGTMAADTCCNGYYLEPATHATTVADLTRDLQPHRLSILWLNGVYIDRGTISTPGAPPAMADLLTPASATAP